jgi:hypothetical protein
MPYLLIDTGPSGFGWSIGVTSGNGGIVGVSFGIRGQGSPSTLHAYSHESSVTRTQQTLPTPQVATAASRHCVIGEAGDPATRIENRIGESAANPYLYLASQIHAGLDGLAHRLRAPIATDSPYGGAGECLPTSLGEALLALRADPVLVAGLGEAFVSCFAQVKTSEIERYDAAEDKDDFQRREYFARS